MESGSGMRGGGGDFTGDGGCGESGERRLTGGMTGIESGEGRSVGDREEIWEEEGRRSWRGNGWMARQLRGGLPKGE